MRSNNELQGHLLALITIIIWGTTFISTKILLRVITPIEILFIRFAIGFLALLLAYPRRLRLRERKQEAYFAAAGLCGVTLYYLLENIALTYTLASNVGVVTSIAPFFTAALAHFFLKGERLKVRFFVGFALALVGIVFISFGGSGAIAFNPLGDILAVLAALMWAIYSVLTKKISGFQYNTIQATRRVFFYGLLFMIPALFVFGFKPRLADILQPVNLLNIVFLGLGASALCFVTWGFAVKTLGAVKTSVYIYVVPVVTVICSVLILHETITGPAALGIGLTVAGLLVSQSKAFERKGRIRTYIDSNRF